MRTLASNENFDFERIAATLSPFRLQPFLMRAGHDEQKALRLYIWHAKLSQEFHFLLHMLEITLRTKIDDAFIRAFSHYWFEDPSFHTLLSEEYKRRIMTLLGQYRSITGHVRDDFITRIQMPQIAMFFSQMFDEKVWKAELRNVFPYGPDDLKREEIFMRLMSIKELRNLVAHHECLLGRSGTNESAGILKLLAWACPDVRRFAVTCSEVGTLLKTRP